MRKIRAENRELKRANDILKSASAFFAAEQGRSNKVIIDYINRYKSEYGVEPICRVLTEHGCSIAPYYEARGRAASRRAVRDEELEVEISCVHAENYSVRGARKVWLEMRREGIDLARCTVQ